MDQTLAWPLVAAVFNAPALALSLLLGPHVMISQPQGSKEAQSRQGYRKVKGSVERNRVQPYYGRQVFHRDDLAECSSSRGDDSLRVDMRGVCVDLRRKAIVKNSICHRDEDGAA